VPTGAGAGCTRGRGARVSILTPLGAPCSYENAPAGGGGQPGDRPARGHGRETPPAPLIQRWPTGHVPVSMWRPRVPGAARRGSSPRGAPSGSLSQVTSNPPRGACSIFSKSRCDLWTALRRRGEAQFAAGAARERWPSREAGRATAHRWAAPCPRALRDADATPRAV
jgi:hypothetical protein